MDVNILGPIFMAVYYIFSKCSLDFVKKLYIITLLMDTIKIYIQNISFVYIRYIFKIYKLNEGYS